MLNKNLVLIALVIFAAGCGTEVRTYVMTKDRVGLDRGNGNGGCIIGTCPPPPPPTETTRRVYVLEITKPVPESEVQKIESTAVNAIADSAPTVSSEAAPVDQPAATDNAPAAAAAPAAPAVPVVGELPGQGPTDEATAPSTESATGAVGGPVTPGQTYTVQKDDTLQKISKKVYGTYAKWYKIYKANKDKINNPNVLQPGTVLTLPVFK